jgi:hypothetical protein
MSPDIRYGHPWPSLSRRNLRFALQAALAFYARDMTRATPSRHANPEGEATGRRPGKATGGKEVPLAVQQLSTPAP